MRGWQGALLGFVLAVGGCGYQFAGARSPYAPELDTLSVGPITNATREVGLERALVEALEDEVTLRGLFDLAETNEAELALTGTIQAYETFPISFNSRNEALEYAVRLIADLELRNTGTGKVLWQRRRLEGFEEYGAISDVVTTSSSRFQRSNPAAADLDQFVDIQVSESQKREATERLVETLSREIYNGMLEDF